MGKTWTPRVDDGDPLAGRTLGEFLVCGRLAEGGCSTVYLARQPKLSREAVIKVMWTQEAGDLASVHRFLREAHLASRLDHPYVAHLYDFGAEPDGLLWMAMEHVRGTPLDKLLAREGPLPVERFMPLLQRVCEVLHTAHQQGIVHRDIKPANLMVLPRAGQLLPKLLDFGIAKRMGAPAMPGEAQGPRRERDDPGARTAAVVPGAAPPGLQTRLGQVLGSPHYMAPEQWVDASIANAHTDLYALGALAYEALTGQHVFTGDTLLDLARAHALEPVPPLGPGFPSALDAVLARAMAKRASERFSNALEFASAFRAAARRPVDSRANPAREPSPRRARRLRTSRAPARTAENPVDTAPDSTRRPARSTARTSTMNHPRWLKLRVILGRVAVGLAVARLCWAVPSGPERASSFSGLMPGSPRQSGRVTLPVRTLAPLVQTERDVGTGGVRPARAGPALRAPLRAPASPRQRLPGNVDPGEEAPAPAPQRTVLPQRESSWSSNVETGSNRLEHC